MRQTSFKGNTSGRQKDRWIQRAIKTALVLALLVGLWYLAGLLWLVLAPPTPFTGEITHSQAEPDVNAYRLFEVHTPMVATRLEGVRVVGVMPAVPNAKSRAMLEVMGVLQAFGVDDVVGDTGHSLAAVGLDEVVLINQTGDKVVLKLHEPILGRDLTDGNSTGVIDNGSLMRYSANVNANASQSSPTNFQGNSAQNAHAESASNQGNPPQSPAPQNPPQAPSTDGQFISAKTIAEMGLAASDSGYQVTDNLPQEIRSRLGLQTGDKLVSLNGMLLGQDTAKDMDSFRSLEGTVTMQIQRGNEVITIRQDMD